MRIANMEKLLTEEKIITLKISKGKFNFLLATVKGFCDNIYKWGFDKFFEKKLLDDLKIIKTILEDSK